MKRSVYSPAVLETLRTGQINGNYDKGDFVSTWIIGGGGVRKQRGTECYNEYKRGLNETQMRLGAKWKDLRKRF